MRLGRGEWHLEAAQLQAPWSAQRLHCSSRARTWTAPSTRRRGGRGREIEHVRPSPSAGRASSEGRRSDPVARAYFQDGERRGGCRGVGIVQPGRLEVGSGASFSSDIGTPPFERPPIHTGSTQDTNGRAMAGPWHPHRLMQPRHLMMTDRLSDRCGCRDAPCAASQAPAVPAPATSVQSVRPSSRPPPFLPPQPPSLCVGRRSRACEQAPLGRPGPGAVRHHHANGSVRAKRAPYCYAFPAAATQ
ncbi:hypothetical protein SAMN04488144_1753 [Methylobacterium sp. 190mf]|nr:hypothetical protein SAMN04488144_1753 [Methylobacterium sp. 190mf]